MIDSAAMLETVVHQLMAQIALFAFIALLPIIGILAGGWILRATENAVTGLALRLEDTRKKKRDEYDAYYEDDAS